jgi:hypothetical protein
LYEADALALDELLVVLVRMCDSCTAQAWSPAENSRLQKIAYQTKPEKQYMTTRACEELHMLKATNKIVSKHYMALKFCVSLFRYHVITHVIGTFYLQCFDSIVSADSINTVCYVLVLLQPCNR